jgi:CheY-like chemotaxis protein
MASRGKSLFQLRTIMRAESVSGIAGKHILVVEDDYFVAADLTSELEAAGAVILGPVNSVQRALALLADQNLRIDAASLDINLNGELVYPLADVLRERRIPFIFCTGYDERTSPPSYRSVPRCEKPFVISDVIRALAQQL